MKEVLAVLLIMIFGGGCAAFGNSPVKAASTVVSYEHTTQNTSRKILYQSDKDQQGFDATYEADENGNPKSVHIKADRSGTPEGLIQAQVEALKVQAQMIQDLVNKILAITAAGAAGS